MKLIKLKSGPYILTSEDPIPHVFPCVVAEKLSNGEYDFFQLDTVNDIDSTTQRVIIGSTNIKIVSLTNSAILDLSEIKDIMGELTEQDVIFDEQGKFKLL